MAQTVAYQIKVNDKTFTVESEAGGLKGTVDGKPFELDLSGSPEQGLHLLYQNSSHRFQVLKAEAKEKRFTLQSGSKTFSIEAADRFDLLLKKLGLEHLSGGGVNDLKAPMPGLVLDVKIKPGDQVKKGQALLILEAMKMENVLKAEADAKVKAVTCQKGDAVEKNQVLVEFEEA